MVETPSTDIAIGTPASDFELPNTNQRAGGARVALRDGGDAQATLIVFMCNHCPYVLHIAGALADTAADYADRSLRVLAISSNDVGSYPQDAPEKMTAFAEQYGFDFPYLYDESQQVARDYGAVCTPDLYLYDGDLRLAYHGQFDGSRPGNKVPVNGEDLRRAIDSVLAGGSPDPVQKPSVGCNIKWIANGP